MADGNYDELVDPRLEKNYDPQEMAHTVSAAAASIRHSARKRPRMSQVWIFLHSFDNQLAQHRENKNKVEHMHMLIVYWWTILCTEFVYSDPRIKCPLRKT